MILFLAQITISDAIIPTAIGACFSGMAYALRMVYNDSKRDAKYAREERMALARSLDANTDAVRQLARNCPVGKAQ